MDAITRKLEVPCRLGHKLQGYPPLIQAERNEMHRETKMKSVKMFACLLLAIGLGSLTARAETGSFERTLQVSGPVSLEVTTGSGSITVRTGGNGTVHIFAKIRAHDSWFGMSAAEKIKNLESNPPIDQQGNTIRVGGIHGWHSGFLSWLGWGSDNVSIDYDLTVPAATGLASRTGSGNQSFDGLQLSSSAAAGSGNITVQNVVGDLRVTTGSGDLKIDSVKGALHADTGSGNIRATGVAGEVSAATGSGNVEVQQAAPGNVTVKTGSGGVTLSGVRGGLKIQTGNGEIRVVGEPKDDWHVGTGSGNIDLTLPSQASFNLDATTSSGSVELHRPLTVQGLVSRNHLQGKTGNGGALLDAHTASGNIEIN
jgi:Putative adhesin